MAGLPQRIAAAAVHAPGLRRPEAREAVLRWVREVRRARRLAAERLGRRALSWPALYDMDRKLARHLPARPGTFVEAGAYDGFEQSNTYRLERFGGWTGVLVEPVPELYRLAVRERPGSQVYNCALVPPEEEGRPVEMHAGGLVSLVKGAHGSPEADLEHARIATMDGWRQLRDVTARGRTLTSVLDEAGVGAFDFLSLDVEGYEAPVLRGLDIDRHPPAFVLVEMRDVDALRRGIEAALGDRYEEAERLSPFDVLYRRLD